LAQIDCATFMQISDFSVHFNSLTGRNRLYYSDKEGERRKDTRNNHSIRQSQFPDAQSCNIVTGTTLETH
jgi:hypothetical protein